VIPAFTCKILTHSGTTKLSMREKRQLGALALGLARSVGINSLARETSAKSGSKTENRDRLRLLQREPCPERRDRMEKRPQALAAPKTETGAANCETSLAVESNRARFPLKTGRLERLYEQETGRWPPRATNPTGKSKPELRQGRRKNGSVH
jgi:hypothetical protein